MLRIWGNEFIIKLSVCWICIIFIIFYDVVCIWVIEEWCVGFDDERENNSKLSCGNDSFYYERIYVKVYV